MKQSLQFLVFTMLCFCGASMAQEANLDSLKKQAEIQRSRNDTGSINTLIELASGFRDISHDSLLKYSEEARSLAVALNYKKGEALALKWIGMYYFDIDAYLKAQDYWNSSLQAFEEAKDVRGQGNLLNNLGLIMLNLGEKELAEQYYKKALNLAELSHDTIRQAAVANNISTLYRPDTAKKELAILWYRKAYLLSTSLGNTYAASSHLTSIASIYLQHGNYDSSLFYLEIARNIKPVNPFIESNIHALLGENLIAKKKYHAAIAELQTALQIGEANQLSYQLANANLGLGKANMELGEYTSALQFLTRAKEISSQNEHPYLLKKSALSIAEAYYRMNNLRQAFMAQKQAVMIFDSIGSAQYDSLQSFNTMVKNFQKSRDSIDYAKEKDHLNLRIETITERSRYKTISFIAVISLALASVGFLYYSNRHKQKTNALLSQQKAELEKTLSELRSTQSKLILSEKMASLGQLTAGIAHEIQNPLNFVNNFSELNGEMLEELKTEINSNNQHEALSLVDNLIQNTSKLTHHGKRADSIVKGMLQHTRLGVVGKECTAINKLADEFLRISYHAVRDRDKSFTAELNTEYDPRIHEIPITPQDMGRVMLNLYNNSFYAMLQKKLQHGSRYVPAIHVKTEKLDNRVLITVRDNGAGIAKSNQDKIFQPFFTTKPAGEGAGLGLSISYDTIKGYGGEIHVSSEEGVFTEIAINLPGS